MKKIYQIPETAVIQMVAEQMIAESHLSINNETENSLSSEEILVKGDRASYDIWDED